MNKPADHSFAKRRGQAGFSLVELMVSVAVGLLLLVIVLKIFLGSNDTYRVTENYSRLQENGRYIMDEMSRDIRMAGYMGCSKNAKIHLLVDSTDKSWATFNQAIQGYESVPSGLGLKEAEVMADTDIVRVQRASAADGNLTGNLETDDANIKISSNPDDFAAGDTLIVADCASADIFCATSVSSASGKVNIAHAKSCNGGTAPKLSKLYGPNAQVMRLSTSIYYIGAGSEGCEAHMLCRKTLSGSALVVEQLIDNVENMQLEYGLDTDGDAAANRFVSAPSVGDSNWNNVVSVRLHLLLRSSQSNLTPSPQAYTFNGATVTPTDRRMRRVYSSTVTLRNRTM